MWFKWIQAIASMSGIILILYMLPGAMLFAVVRCVTVWANIDSFMIKILLSDRENLQCTVETLKYDVQY